MDPVLLLQSGVTYFFCTPLEVRGKYCDPPSNLSPSSVCCRVNFFTNSHTFMQCLIHPRTPSPLGTYIFSGSRASLLSARGHASFFVLIHFVKFKRIQSSPFKFCYSLICDIAKKKSVAPPLEVLKKCDPLTK